MLFNAPIDSAGQHEPQTLLTHRRITAYTFQRFTTGAEPMDSPFMARAIQLSLDNVLSGKGGPFGAVIVQNGKIIAEGVNRVTASNDPTAHAEVVAIREACATLRTFELTDCEIYTSCEPCPMCLGAIYWARLARVYYGNLASDASQIGFDDSFIYREIAQVVRKRSIPMVPMMREQALAAFRAWQDKPNKIPY
jgi:guanine deaminase